MKIREVRTHVLRYELAKGEEFAGSRGFRGDRQSLLVEITTDQGLAGFGEAHGLVAATRAQIEQAYAPRLVGRGPLDQGVLWQELYGANRHGGPGLSAVDLALWDLKGQILGQPVYRLLGGAFRTRVRAYATGLFHRHVPDNTRALAEEAAGHRADGFRGMKLKVGFGVDEDVRNVRAVREAIGPDGWLAMDANEVYDAGTALRLAHRVADCDLAWFEEPVPHDDLDGYAQMHGVGVMPLAGGETLYARADFHALLTRKLVDVFQPDLGGCGGFSEAWPLAHLAQQHGIAVVPHMFGTAVLLFATLQLIAALPHASAGAYLDPPLLEYDRTPNALRDHLALNPPARDGDLIAVPDGPGLGLQIDRAALKRFSV